MVNDNDTTVMLVTNKGPLQITQHLAAFYLHVHYNYFYYRFTISILIVLVDIAIIIWQQLILRHFQHSTNIDNRQKPLILFDMNLNS